MGGRGGIGMMTFALALLVVPGILYNNANNSGLVVNPGTVGNCDNNLDICNITNASGCQANAANCNLSGQTVSLLNACSPFTNLLAANFIGFVDSFFSNCGVLPSQVVPNPQYLQLLGQVPKVNETFTGCVPTDLIINNASNGAQRIDAHFTCYQTSPPVPGFVMPINFSYGVLASWTGIIGHVPPGNNVPTFTKVATLDKSSSQNPMTAQCVNYANAGSNSTNMIICHQFAPNVTPNSITGGGNTLTGGVLGFVLSIVGGVLLLLIGLGLSVTVPLPTTQASVGANPQGSKLAQALGIGLLIWGPLYSEFSTWFTSGILPYGLDGLTGLIDIILIAVFFFGTFQVSQSGSLL